ncbi:MAG: bifunctional riboflavin kinase/FAD synthetase [Candidatus Nanopelagicales bacterium]
MSVDVWKGSPVHVVVIGVFDGVHRGHQALVQRAVARSEGGVVTAVTFDPHPAAILRPESTPAALSGVPRRVRLLEAAGADQVRVVGFNEELSQMTPEEFVDHLLGDLLIDVADDAGQTRPVDLIVTGENFRFGKGATGNAKVLAELGRDRGFGVDVVPLVTEEVPGEGATTWSSSYVRGRIAAGDLPGAARVLGRPHRIEGIVVHGEHRGRDLGYPTANIDLSLGYAIPPDGVYAGWFHTDTHTWAAAVSVGTNPQFAGTVRTVEAFCIGQTDLDLYGQLVSLDFVARIRSQQVFADVAALIEQMAHDVRQATIILGAPSPDA